MAEKQQKQQDVDTKKIISRYKDQNILRYLYKRQ